MKQYVVGVMAGLLATGAGVVLGCTMCSTPVRAAVDQDYPSAVQVGKRLRIEYPGIVATCEVEERLGAFVRCEKTWYSVQNALSIKEISNRPLFPLGR